MITSRITLNGFRTTIAGNGTSFRILLVAGSGNLTLQGLTITGGKTGGPGGGIFNLEGTLTINHSKVTGNASEGAMMSAGGGIASGTLGTGPLGTTTLNFSQVTGNTTSGSAGGILNHAGTLTLNASQVNGNVAAVGGGGIACGTGGMGGNGGAPGGPLTLKLSQVTSNTAAEGGGIYASSGSPVAFKLTLVARNVPNNCIPLGIIPGCKG